MFNFVERYRQCDFKTALRWLAERAHLTVDRLSEKIVTEYPYLDEHGALLFQVVRLKPKAFRQRRPDGRGGWVYNLNGTRRVLYRVPELQGKEAVALVEGEQDVDRLWSCGILATTAPGGAGKWRPEYVEQLTWAGVRRLAIIPDNDDPGRAHAEQVAASCHAAGLEVRIVALPDVPPKGDVSNYLDHHPKDELPALLRSAPLYRLDERTSSEQTIQVAAAECDEGYRPDATGVETHKSQVRSGKTVLARMLIDAGDLDLPRVSAHALKALQDANDPPRLFRYGGLPVRVEHDETDLPELQRLSDDRLRHELARAAYWFKQTEEGDRPALPPKHVVADLLASPSLDLPRLTAIIRAPAFTADGELHEQPGYHLNGRIYYAPPSGLSIPDVARHPSQDDIDRARALLLDDLLGDFPFVDEAERAHAGVLLLLPFVRNLIAGPTPLHLIEKPTPGTGGSLLAAMLLLPASGDDLSAMTEGRDEDEWRKRITARLRSSPSAILIDNLRRRLDSSALAAAITATVHEDRILGTSDTVRLPIRCVWIATGNNPTLSAELTRRAVRIRLDAKLDRPWLREGFRHADLRAWASTHRGELVWAALVLGRAWIVAGRPQGAGVLGMFEQWSRVMGGILEGCRYPWLLGKSQDVLRPVGR